MLELSLRFDDPSPVAMSVVAKRASISKPYLDQLAMALRHANLIRGRAGRRGGYVLSRPPKDILLREIVEAVIGEVNVTECVADPGVCARSEFCACRQVWQEINTRIRSVLDDYTLEELTNHEQRHGERGSDTESKLIKISPVHRTSTDREASQA